MGWYLRKSFKLGPVRLNLSKSGLGMSAGIKGLRAGTGPRGAYVTGGRKGLYFWQSLREERNGRASRSGVPGSIVVLGILFLILLLVLMARAGEPIYLHFSGGLVRPAAACWDEGTTFRYRAVDGQNYQVPRETVVQIDGTCEASRPEPAPAASSSGSDTTPSNTAAPTVSSPSTTSPGQDVNVRGHYRKDGTYVRPHTRSLPGTGGGRRK